mmetsp:Transcript_28481/g.52959  ORF Transcript_28481/g.52959 Transcript_28481/m.52959 type:complete len:472 (-) Transcript_28481:80-1495(-)
MVRVKVKGTFKKPKMCPEDEPDFSSMPPVGILSNTKQSSEAYPSSQQEKLSVQSTLPREQQKFSSPQSERFTIKRKHSNTHQKSLREQSSSRNFVADINEALAKRTRLQEDSDPSKRTTVLSSPQTVCIVCESTLSSPNGSEWALDSPRNALSPQEVKHSSYKQQSRKQNAVATSSARKWMSACSCKRHFLRGPEPHDVLCGQGGGISANPGHGYEMKQGAFGGDIDDSEARCKTCQAVGHPGCKGTKSEDRSDSSIAPPFFGGPFQLNRKNSEVEGARQLLALSATADTSCLSKTCSSFWSSTPLQPPTTQILPGLCSDQPKLHMLPHAELMTTNGNKSLASQKRIEGDALPDQCNGENRGAKRIEEIVENYHLRMHIQGGESPAFHSDLFATFIDPLNASSREQHVQRWLTSVVPCLMRDDIKAYTRRLVDDGFDSIAIIEDYLLEEDLSFMKTAHRRALVKKLKKGWC